MKNGSFMKLQKAMDWQRFISAAYFKIEEKLYYVYGGITAFCVLKPQSDI